MRPNKILQMNGRDFSDEMECQQSSENLRTTK